MKTAQDFAQAALNIRAMADRMKPADTDIAAQERKLIQYHLNVAAGRTRAIADVLERTKGTA